MADIKGHFPALITATSVLNESSSSNGTMKFTAMLTGPSVSTISYCRRDFLGNRPSLASHSYALVRAEGGSEDDGERDTDPNDKLGDAPNHGILDGVVLCGGLLQKTLKRAAAVRDALSAASGLT